MTAPISRDLPLTGKVALVSGATRGIGLAIATRLAELGADVAALDLAGSDPAEFTAAVTAAGRRSLFCAGDVTDSAAWTAALAAIEGTFRGLDILVNNAGIGGYIGSLLDYPEDQFDAVMAINAKGVFLGMKQCLPALIARAKSGASGSSVVNIASISGMGGGTGVFAYTASKHAVVGMTLSAAAEMASKGVRVNAVCPAPTQTRMIDELAETRSPDDPAAFAKAFAAALPMGRYADAREIAEVVAFLTTPAASFVNGAILPVDGGAKAR